VGGEIFSDEDGRKEFSRWVLLLVAVALLSFLWPLVISALILWGMYKAFKYADLGEFLRKDA